MTSHKRKCTFFNVIMRSNEADRTNLGLHISRSGVKDPICISEIGAKSLSEACGLKVGDVLDMVNGEKVGLMSVEDVVKLISSNKDKIHLQIRRESSLKHCVPATDSSHEEGTLASTTTNTDSGDMKRSKLKKTSCASFMKGMFRSRSQDQCVTSTSKTSTARSSSMIVHLSNSVLSTPQSNFKKFRRLSSCMKIFKSKGNEKENPEIDVTVPPNHTNTQPYTQTTTQHHNHTTTQLYNQTTTQHHNQTTTQHHNQTTTQLYKHPTTQPDNQNTTQPYKYTTTQPHKKTTTQAHNHLITQTNNHITRQQNKQHTSSRQDNDNTIPQPNNQIINPTYKHSIEHPQNISEVSTGASDHPISLNVINSQVSSSSSSPHTIVNVSPNLKILTITTPTETPETLPLQCYLLNYTQPESSTNETITKTSVRSDLKSEQLTSQTNIQNQSNIDAYANTAVSKKALYAHKFKMAPTNEVNNPAPITVVNKIASIEMVSSDVVTTTVVESMPSANLSNSLYTMSNKSSPKNFRQIPNSQVFQSNSVSIPQGKEFDDSTNKSTETLKITLETRPTTENLEKELEVGSVSYQSDLDGMSRETHFLENTMPKNEMKLEKEFVIVAPKRHTKNILTSTSNSKSNTTTSLNASTKTSQVCHNNEITTKLHSNNTKKRDVERLEELQCAEEQEKAELDRILDEALLKLKAEASLSHSRADPSNKQDVSSANQNRSKTGCENMSYDTNKYLPHNTTCISSSIDDKADKPAYITKADIFQADRNHEIINKKSTESESLTFYSMNNGFFDVGSNLKSPDSGISSILSPSDLRERLEQSRFKANDYHFIQGEEGNHIQTNINSINEDKNDSNSINEMNKKDKKLINIVTPTEANLPQRFDHDDHKGMYLIQHQNSTETFNELQGFKHTSHRSEIEIKGDYDIPLNRDEVDSFKESHVASRKASFVDEFGAPVVKPPSYNSVVYCGVTDENAPTTSNNNNFPRQTSKTSNFSSPNIQDFRFETAPSPSHQQQHEQINYDNFNNKTNQNPHVSRNQEGIYEQIPANNKSHFVYRDENLYANNHQHQVPQEVFKSQLDHYQDHQMHNNTTTKNNNKIAKLDDYIKVKQQQQQQQQQLQQQQLQQQQQQQLHTCHQGYYFSDTTDKDTRERETRQDFNGERDTPIELQRNEVIDELKRQFIGHKGTSEAFYSSRPTQSFNPIDQQMTSNWSFNDLSSQNLALDTTDKPAYVDQRKNNLLDMESEHENLDEIEKQRLYIKGVHQARNHEFNMVSEKSNSTQEMMYEGMQHPSRTSITKYRGKARAIHNFRARKPVELSLRKGEIVFLLRKIDKNWLEGEHHNMTGIFPLSYVEILESLEDAQAVARLKEGSGNVLYDFHPRSPLELALKKGYVVTLVRRIDDNWYEGRFGNKRGIFPASYVSAMREPDTPLPTPCASPLPIPQHSGWRSPSVMSMFSMDFPSACPSEFNVDFSRGSTPMGGSILEGYIPGGQTLPRSSSVLSAPHFIRNQPFNPTNQSYNHSNVPLSHNNNTFHHTSSKQFRQTPMIEEEFEEFPPQKPLLHCGESVSRMSRLQSRNQFTNVPLYNNEGSHEYQHRRDSNMKASESLDRRNTPSHYAIKHHYEPQKNQQFHNNQLISGSYTLNRNVQRNDINENTRRILPLNYEREIDTVVKPVIYPRYRALHNFDARKSEEIDLVKGDVVRVVERCRDGWYIGFVESNRNFGMFPGTFVEAFK